MPGMTGRRGVVLAGLVVAWGCSGKTGPLQDAGPVDRMDALARDVPGEARADVRVWDAQPDRVYCSRPYGEDYGWVEPLPWPPEPEEYDFCGQVFFKLPLDMWAQGSRAYVWLHGDRLAYLAWDAVQGPSTSDIFYFDLRNCRQYLVAWQKPQAAVNAALWGRTLAGKWALPCPGNGCYFFLVDLETWEREQVTWDDNDLGSLTAAFNGRYLGDYTGWKLPDGGILDQAVVLDVETGQREVVASAREAPDWMLATEGFLTWIEFGDRGFGRWAVWYDPVAGEKHVIEETVPEYQEAISAWGTKIAGHWGETYQHGPYHVWVYDVATGDYEEVAVERATPFPDIWGNVIAMRTHKYREEPQGAYPVDIVLLDLETGVERRVTRQPGMVFLPRGFRPPWLVIGVYGGWPHHTYWVLNVYEAGLIDQDGHVIPGDPVIDPPTPED